MIAVAVVGRYFFGHPFQWSQEIATLALLALFGGAMLALRERYLGFLGQQVGASAQVPAADRMPGSVR